jgi:hypothetical protein
MGQFNFRKVVPQNETQNERRKSYENDKGKDEKECRMKLRDK